MIKTEKLGENEFTVVEFGTGDIGMVQMSTKPVPDKTGNSVCFYQDKPKPVEKWAAQPHDFKTSDDLPSDPRPVMFKFTRRESIVSVIETLQELLDQYEE